MRSRSLALALSLALVILAAGWCVGSSTSGREASAKEATPGISATSGNETPAAQETSPEKGTPPAKPVPPAESELQRQVRAAEQAFARTMADRDHTAFASFLADETIFMSEKRTLRGKSQVTEGWKGFYSGAQPPFAWEPESVEVLESGALALSTGPVLDPQGNRVGTFNSIWRREADGKWRVVFDKGCPPCNCK